MWLSGMLLEVLVMLNPSFTLWIFSLSGVHPELLCTSVAEPTDLAMVS